MTVLFSKIYLLHFLSPLTLYASFLFTFVILLYKTFVLYSRINTYYMASFGENLKQIRAERNISQGELAELIGMHSTHISRYERDLTQPTLEVIKKMADVLSSSTDTLIYGNVEQQAKNKIKDPELLSMFNKIQSLDKKDVDVIKSLLNAYILKTDLQEKFKK